IDHKAGIIYIFMEYCGGGDLSAVIEEAANNNLLIPEDMIWRYFMEILLALKYCRYPGHGGWEENKRRPILHRGLKPANGTLVLLFLWGEGPDKGDMVFLDESGSVKLGDFGLSKALSQASLTTTCVGTPYYMSPELIQEKAYDSKADIWALGCMIYYELCTHKPPFHEAKMRSELSELIQCADDGVFNRNGRILPLPRGYSQDLFDVIMSMLRLNPEKRPSVAQLLEHEGFNSVY
ncbi:kinase-like domain-containing protein, partial [Cyathus striatus]